MGMVVAPHNKEPVTFVILSWEGPDLYSFAGGLASRVVEMSETLASMGYETHLFFIGDPTLPGHEVTEKGVHLHRWCQWISEFFPAGVYDGMDRKLADWTASLPPWVASEMIAPKVAEGRHVVIMGEDWHTAASITALHEIVMQRGWQNQVSLCWNANNVYGFERINRTALQEALTVTTVSRFMKQLMQREYGFSGVRVVGNGISSAWVEPLDNQACLTLQQEFGDRLALVKVARSVPEKGWLQAVQAVAELKSLGLQPLFLAKGGKESHHQEVLTKAQEQGLKVVHTDWLGDDIISLVEALKPSISAGAGFVDLKGFLSFEQRRVLYSVADGVLANSSFEPFGLVPLETMSVSGIALAGSTGEEYVSGWDAIRIETNDPGEIVSHVIRLKRQPELAQQIRKEARNKAAQLTWRAVIQRELIPLLEEMGLNAEIGRLPQVMGATVS